MKGILLFMALTVSFSGLVAQDHVEFIKDNWTEVLKIAAQENKIVFVDAYTTWCGPCKLMDKRTFSNKEVSTFFNGKFINAKIDMEKGDGPELARKYGVAAYPTLLFIDASGKEIHRGLGYHDGQQLLELAAVALDGSQTTNAFDDKFKSGNRDLDFLFVYVDKKMELQNGSHLPVAEAILETKRDWKEGEKNDFVYSYLTDTDTKLFDYLLDNKAVFQKRFGAEEVDKKISDLIYQESSLEMKTEELVKLDKLFKKVNPKTAKKESANFRMAYFRQKGERQLFGLAAKKYMKYNKDARAPELNDLAWTFYQVIEDPKLIKTAIKWSKKSIALAPRGYSFETLASLYEKSGDKTKAIETLKEGIVLNKAANEDTRSLEELLKTFSTTISAN